jgi:hypothetical protein
MVKKKRWKEKKNICLFALVLKVCDVYLYMYKKGEKKEKKETVFF